MSPLFFPSESGLSVRTDYDRALQADLTGKEDGCAHRIEASGNSGEWTSTASYGKVNEKFLQKILRKCKVKYQSRNCYGVEVMYGKTIKGSGQRYRGVKSVGESTFFSDAHSNITID
ncbi:MAG: hypothetical protein HDR26_05510 [Lachnospiraceae bacterium]|nr:hypothetical protein [Lachnospiraceae bacterium]